MSLAQGGTGEYTSWTEDGADDRFRRKQSRDAKERDGYICQECGRRSKKRDMHGHHIIPVKDWWRQEHYPVDWVVTLCTQCHAQTEQQSGFIKMPEEKYRKQQTTLDQFDEDKTEE